MIVPRLIIFVSDNGGRWPNADNGPLRGSKGTLYEGGIHVPLAIAWPGQEISASTDFPVLTRDLAPTILEIAGVAHDDAPMDGRSFALLRERNELSTRPLHWHFPVYLEAYGGMTGPWRTTPAAAVRDGRYKLFEFFEDGHIELYDLEADPRERTNIAEGNQAVVARMRSEMERWREHVGAALPTPLESPESKVGGKSADLQEEGS